MGRKKPGNKSGKKLDGRTTHPPTQRQQKFAQALAKGETLTDVALEAGYSPKNPGQSGYQALQHLRWRSSALLDHHS
jgi:hypothetical protein